MKQCDPNFDLKVNTGCPKKRAPFFKCCFSDFETMSMKLLHIHCLWVLLMGICIKRRLSFLKEKDQKQLNHNQNESIYKTKLFDANFIKIGLQTITLLKIENLEIENQ